MELRKGWNGKNEMGLGLGAAMGVGVGEADRKGRKGRWE